MLNRTFHSKNIKQYWIWQFWPGSVITVPVYNIVAKEHMCSPYHKHNLSGLYSTTCNWTNLPASFYYRRFHWLSIRLTHGKCWCNEEYPTYEYFIRLLTRNLPLHSGRKRILIGWIDIKDTHICPLGSSWSWSYGSWIYNYLRNQCISPQTLKVRITIRWCVLDTTLCNKVCQWLAADRWFSPGTPVYSTNKTVRRDIKEILLNVALNTITLSLT
jgi:hypothetical protein